MSDSMSRTINYQEGIELQKIKLFNVIQKHWCPSFPYDEDCKSCSLEIEICEKLWDPCGIPMDNSSEEKVIK